MALINRPMYEHFGTRHLGVKGPGALTTLEEGVMGVLPLDVMSDPAYWFIQGIRSFSAVTGTVAAAGEFATLGLAIENTSSSTICRIISIDASSGSGSGGNFNAQLYRCLRTDFTSDPGVYGHGTDTRIPEGQPSDGILLNSTHASKPGVQLGDYHTAGDPDWFSKNRIPLIVSPGQCIYLADGTANQTLYTTFTWVEIPAYRAEL